MQADEQSRSGAQQLTNDCSAYDRTRKHTQNVVLVHIIQLQNAVMPLHRHGAGAMNVHAHVCIY